MVITLHSHIAENVEMQAGSDLVYLRSVGNGRGRGGMESKLAAARIANEAGGAAIIANGRTPGVLDLICSGKSVGTLFSPGKRP